MTDERRYDETEVAAILEVAAEAESATRPRAASRASGDGLTLGELQEIAAEVGIPTELVAQAARRMDARLAGAASSYLGVPVGVERTLDLPRGLTEVEWQRLVLRLRETFQATGRSENVGGFQSWQNGNLRITVEPTETGSRLRMSTRKGDVVPLATVSLSMMAMAVVLFVVGMITVNVDVGAPLFLALAGLGLLGANLARLPFWAGRRARQMEAIAAEVSETTALPPAESTPQDLPSTTGRAP